MITDYPKSERLFGRLPAEHRAHDYRGNSLFLAQLECFLRLVHLPGFERKLAEFRRYSHGNGSNNRYVSWFGFCAELTALSILTKLGFEIREFEALSPQRIADRKTCDFRTIAMNHERFIEVRCKASEEKQTPPELLRKQLEALVGGRFHYALELHQRDLSSASDAMIAELRQWIDSPKNPRSNGLPRPFRCDDFSVYFYSNGPSALEVTFFEPDSPLDIENWLLVTGLRGKNGKVMKPQAQQAVEKGADWLICSIHPWDPLDQILKAVFKPSAGQGRTIQTSDPRVGSLSGIIAFQSTDAANFCVVEKTSQTAE